MPDPRTPDRKNLDPSDPHPCHGCSNCCEYVAVGIDPPKSVDDFDEILWFLIHKDVWVFVDEDNRWYVQYNTPCEKLDGLRCGYYHHRPKICRTYKVKGCFRYGDGVAEKILFKNELDLFRYLASKRPKTFRRLKEKINIPFDEKNLVG